MRASIGLSASDLQPSSHNILETLSYEEKLPVTHLAALLWIISILFLFSFVWGGVFDLGADLSFVCQFFYFWIIGFYITFNKSECPICFGSY